ncbi:MAG: tetratricopeptide repeat protein [Magnetococcales bacterium]|nr:tetratricopeptide repeat protein [Magnetococcales bacterium]
MSLSPSPAPDGPGDRHKERGNAFLAQGRLADAAQAYRLALACQPDHHRAMSNLGIVFQAQGRLEDAVDCFSRALAMQPEFAAAHSNLGVVLHRMGRLHEARTHLLRALELEPAYPEALSNLGNLYLSQGRWLDAVACYRRALTENPAFPDALANLGVALQHLGNLSQSALCLEGALNLEPNSHEYWTNLGVVRYRQGNLESAMACLDRALRLKPDHPDALANLGCLLMEQGHLSEALSWIGKAVHIAPELAEAHFAESLVLLLSGDFKKGWEKHEWRWRRSGFPPHGRPEPLWDGHSLAGRSILLHCEQGLGDSIQFVRFAPEVKARGGTVLLRCPQPLARLMATAAGIDRWVLEGEEGVSCDTQAPLMSLPWLLGTTLETLPAVTPYLHATHPSPLPRSWMAGPNMKVGLVWRGNPMFRDDGKRSMDPSHLVPLLGLAGITFIGLQVDLSPGEREFFASFPNFFDAGNLLTDFAVTAAVIQELDLVISVDTAVLHLGGALGRPTWALLPKTPDWRWLLEREDSPWYPTMRLFRQKNRGDWLEVMDRIARKLSAAKYPQ